MRLAFKSVVFIALFSFSACAGLYEPLVGEETASDAEGSEVLEDEVETVVQASEEAETIVEEGDEAETIIEYGDEAEAIVGTVDSMEEETETPADE